MKIALFRYYLIQRKLDAESLILIEESVNNEINISELFRDVSNIEISI
jgi:hypothetical protein